MKKVLLPAVVAVLFISLATNVYFLWPRESPLARGCENVSEKKMQANDPLRQFMPDGWSVTSDKVRVLDGIYLPFLHRNFKGQKVRVVHIEGPGVIFRGGERGNEAYLNGKLTRGTIVALAETQHLLRVALHGEIPLGPLPGEMSLKEAEEDYLSIGEKGLKLAGLPKNPPRKSLQEIFDTFYPGKIGEGVGREPYRALRITMIYVKFPPGADPETRMLIHFHEFHSPGPSGADPRYDCYEFDENGKSIGTITIP